MLIGRGGISWLSEVWSHNSAFPWVLFLSEVVSLFYPSGETFWCRRMPSLSNLEYEPLNQEHRPTQFLSCLTLPRTYSVKTAYEDAKQNLPLLWGWYCHSKQQGIGFTPQVSPPFWQIHSLPPCFSQWSIMGLWIYSAIVLFVILGWFQNEYRDTDPLHWNI